MESREVKVLIDRAKRGDRSAFDELVRAHQDRLTAMIRTRMGPRLSAAYDVRDVVQETLLRAVSSIVGFRWTRDDCFMRWLGGIAEHVVLKLAARYEREQKIAVPLESPRSGTSPSRGLRREERFERLRRAVSKLSPEHRDVILMARIERLRTREIAERMGRTEEATRQLLSRALRSLKTAFGDTDSLGLPPQVLGRDRRETRGS